ncbi:MAG: HD family phosphohydrolase [bacterium]
MGFLGRARRRLTPLFTLPWLPKSAIGLGTFLALLLIATLSEVPDRLDLRAGQIAPQDVEAPRTTDFIDQAQTAIRQRVAAARVEPLYREAGEATAAARAAVTGIFDVIGRVRALSGVSAAERLTRLRQQAGVSLPQEAWEAALTMDVATLAQVRDVTLGGVEQMMALGVRADEFPRAREDLRRLLRSTALTGRPLALASAVGLASLRANLVVDRATTQTLRMEAADAVEPVRVRILRGEIIIRRGDRVTEAHMRRLEALGLVGVPMRWDVVLGVALIIALLLGITGYYLMEYQTEIWRRDRLILLWGLMVVVTTLLARLIVSYRLPLSLVPAAVAVTPILLAVLLRPRLGLLTAATLSLLIALIATSDLRTAFVAFVGSAVGVYAIRRISHRTDLIVGGLKAGAATAAAMVAMSLLERRPVYPEMVGGAAAGVASGIFVGIFSIGVLPYLENFFGLVTPIKLLELSNPGHPLLRRLQMEAPGTYHHSVIVGNLAEAAADAIGADGLLVRVGTYYHDVGKVRRPVFFVENQIGVENPHERMSPNLSALTVAAHVRDGMDLAREYGLPQSVADFIPEHHGTTLITYFYHQAMERGDDPEPAAFRYEGPKPQTRETAIVMLADAAEAAVRALARPTPDRIYDVVRKIIHDRLEDGQLDECDLMFRDLEQIAQTFTRILTGIFHPRIEYPDLEGDLRARRRERVGRR